MKKVRKTWIDQISEAGWTSVGGEKGGVKNIQIKLRLKGVWLVYYLQRGGEITNEGNE